MSHRVVPEATDFWFLPLGGCGEIGMNLNLYGHDGAWLMVDCGVAFDGDDTVMPDPAFIASEADRLVGIVATHAHQDHIGALPDLWEQFRVPIYTTPFTAYILRHRFAERGLSDVPIVTVASEETLTLGPFTVSWLPITHSTLETHALRIACAAGTALHTADWKLDLGPVVGPAFSPELLQSDQSVDAVICDSTNATSPGRSVSEEALTEGLRAEIAGAPGRVVVSCFASNVARLQTLARIANDCGRYLGVMGRSFNLMSEAAMACGYLDESFRLVDLADLGYLPPEEVLLISSGSQGEARAGLARLADDNHTLLNLDPGDRVIFSARVIPGNEDDVAALVAQLRSRGIEVVQPEERALPLHASGHAHEEELAHLYEWTKPRVAIPVHGEDRHMSANARIAAASGVPQQLTGLNGDIFVIAGANRAEVWRQAVPAGRVRSYRQ